jgi:hypothetical protein
MGYRVNSGVTHNAATGIDLAAYVTNYEKLTRVAHTALRSHNPAGRIYISLDSRRAVGTEGGWDVATFLSAFADESRLRGDYPWHVACELYANTPAVWEENAAADTAHYTIRNLGTLTDLLDGTVYRFADQPRRLLIGGYAIPAVGQGETPSGESDNRQAASYAYAYLTCVQNGRIEALIYSAYTDPAPTAAESPLCGLWTVKADADVAEDGIAPLLRPATTRPIYDVFKRIDTTESATLSTGLTAVMGTSYTKLESALSGKASPVTYVQGSTSLEGHDPVHKKAFLLRPSDRDIIPGSAEQAPDPDVVKAFRQAGFNAQSVIIRPDSENPLTHRHERPGVEIHHPVPACPVQFVHLSAHLEPARDMHQRVDFLEGGQDLRRGIVHRSGRRHIAGDQQMLRVVQPRKGLGQLVGMVVEQRQACALRQKVLRHGAAERTGCASEHDVRGSVGGVDHRNP